MQAHYQEEVERYEQELRSLGSRLELKDHMYVSQIHILEEEVGFLQARVQADKEKQEESLNEAR
jgi:hypothetical protein